MYCNKCGNQLNNSAKFCNRCGNVLVDGTSKSHNRALKASLCIFTFCLVFIAVLVVFLNKDKEVLNKTPESRTIMIYMSGSDLESRAAIATSDIKSIKPEEVNLTTTKVILYVGGAKHWYNDFISNEENAIFELTNDGFEKVKTFKQENLGDPDTLADFLNYTTDNYKTDIYSLVLWNHGSGSLGSISDELTQDLITLNEFTKAFDDSEFKSKKKLDSILFRTCLNGTYEMANVLAPYANYLIASEEVTYGSARTSVLDFINDIEITDDAVAYGKKFINSYSEQMKKLDFFGNIQSIYSIIDLNKLADFNKVLDDFFKDIDVNNNNYYEIAQIRNNLIQFGIEAEPAYDTVDLYQLVDKLSIYNSSGANKVKDLMNELIVYRWGNYENANGLAIYFPYRGSEAQQMMHLSRIDSNNSYYDFVDEFSDYHREPIDFSFSVMENEIDLNDREFSLKLTDEQLKYYARAAYLIFKKVDENSYLPIYMSANAELDENGYLRTNIANRLIKVVETDTMEEEYIQVVENGNTYTTNGILQFIPDDTDKFFDEFTMDQATFYFDIENDDVSLGQLVLSSTDGVNGAIAQLENYTQIIFGNFRYDILDENGNYTEDWESNGTLYMLELPADETKFDLKFASLDDEGEYYCVFKVFDIKDNYYYSKLIAI